MPAEKDLKRLIRQRMARTGESYSTARTRVLARQNETSDAEPVDSSVGMKFDGLVEDGRRFVVISDVPPEYSFVVEHTFEAMDGGYRWEYRGDPRDFDQVVANWQRDGAKHIEHSAGIRSGDWAAGLEAVNRRLDGEGVWWFLLGTAALAVRGIDVQPKGVDIGTDPDGAKTIARIFVDKTLMPVTETDQWPIAKIYGRIYWHSLVQVIADSPPEVDRHGPRPWGPEGVSRLESINWRGHGLLVTPLDLQLEDEKQRDRKRNVTEILRWMNA